MEALEIYRKAKEEGDNETALRALQIYKQQQQSEPSFSEKAAGSLEAGLTIGSSIVAEPVAGIAGIAQSINPFADEGAGARAVESTREALTYRPKTETGQEYIGAVGEALEPVAEGLEYVERGLGESVLDATGSEELAAIAHTLPTAVLEALGVGLGKGAAKIPKRQAEMQREKASKLESELADIRGAADFGESATEAGVESAADVLAKNIEQDVQALIKPDAELYEAIDTLGIKGDVPAEFVTQDPQFRALATGLASMPGSKLADAQVNFISEVSKSADDIIDRFGGDLDAAMVSDDFRANALKTIDDLYETETKLYDSFDIPKGKKVEPSNTIAYIEGLAEGANIGDLPAPFRRIYNNLRPKEISKAPSTFDVATGISSKPVEMPSYNKFKINRQNIGKQLGDKMNRSDAFKSLDEGQLKGLYAAMKKDEDAIANSLGFSDQVKAANAQTVKRKAIEQNMTKLLGKELDKDIIPVVQGAIKQLSKENVEKFRRTMARIPEDQAESLAITAMAKMMRGTGQGQESFSANQFLRNMSQIEKQPTLKRELYKYLPEESQKSFDALLKISDSIQKVNNKQIKTGLINALLNPEKGMIAKMAGMGAERAATAVAGYDGAMAVRGIASMLARDGDRAVAMGDLLADPKFQNMINVSVREGVIEGVEASRKLREIEKAVKASDKYEAWAKTLSDSDKVRLTNLGLINFLLMEEE